MAAKRCQGITRDGSRCKNRTLKNSGHCGRCKEQLLSDHLKQESDRGNDPFEAPTKVASIRRPTARLRVARQLSDQMRSLFAQTGSWRATFQKIAPFLASRNCVSGHRFTRSNQLMFSSAAVLNGHATSNWATYRQWDSVGAQVRKGEKGVRGILWKRYTKKDPKYPDDLSKGRKVLVAKEFWVFNLDQVDIPDDHTAKHIYEPVKPQGSAGIMLERAEKSGIKIVHQPDVALTGTPSAQPLYSPSADVISMAPRETFETDEQYAEALAHEMVHMTGHKSRNDRLRSKQMGDTAYAKEELIAELGAVTYCTLEGIEMPKESMHNHAAYLKGWESKLDEKPELWMEVCTEVDKAIQCLDDMGMCSQTEKIEKAA